MASFLIVDDNALVRRALERVFGRYGSCHAAASRADAEREIANVTAWDGFVIDIKLGDGSGLDLLATARRVHARTPAIVISGSFDRGAINRAAVLNARFICKPCGASELAPFLSDVLIRTTGDRLLAATELARHRWNLSPREVEILEATLRGRSRDDYLGTAGMSSNTLKTYVRRLLEKTDHENLASLAIDLLNEN
jgi:DNA-binding NarL/FixJ family response regulator